MGLLKVSEIEPGMTVSRDVVSPQGLLLLPAGAEVEEQHLRVMRIWGVAEVAVQGAEARQVQEQSAPGCSAYVDRLFARCDESQPCIAELRRIAEDSCAKGAAAGDAPLTVHGVDTLGPVPDLLEMVGENARLVTFPDVYFKIQQALEDPTATAAHLAELVGTEPSLAARLLKVVNSPAYGLPRRVDSLVRGVALLGARELSHIALAISVMKSLEGMSSQAFPLKKFWKHSVACAVLARLLASHRPGVPQETCFVSGLMHDIGFLLMAQSIPGLFGSVLRLSSSEGLAIEQAERQVLGWDHAQLGGALFESWGFPPSLVDNVRHHHSPSDSPEPVQAAVIQLANAMAICMGYDFGLSVPSMSPLDQGAWDALSLPLGALENSAVAARRQIDDMVNVFLGDE